MIEKLRQENDVERKIFVENALELLGNAARGQLEDGDGKRNETVANSACATLSESVKQAAGEKLVAVGREELEKIGEIQEHELLADMKKEAGKMMEVLEKIEKIGEVKEEVSSLSSYGDSLVAQKAASVLAKLA